MYLEKNLEKKWLIKSENTILGPYNFDQIIDLIRKRQISLIDEVRDPETRWLYIRENPEFKNVVEEIRKEIDAKQESTKTYQSLSKTDEYIQKTQTDINQLTDINLETRDATIIKEILSQSLDTPIIHSKTVEKPKVYGIQSDKAVQQKMSSFSSRILMMTGIAVVTVAISFGGFVYYQKISTEKQEQELALQIKKYRVLGLYQKAVDIFGKLSSTNQKKIIPELLEIYPLLETTGWVPYDYVKSLSNDVNLTMEQKADLELINFWQSMKQQNYGQARDSLVKATTLMPAMSLVKENDALLSLRKDQQQAANNAPTAPGAYTAFRKLFAQEKLGRYLFGMAMAFNQMSPEEQAQNSHELSNTISSYTSVYYDYRKELLLVQLSLSQMTANDVLYKVSLKQFLNTPCKLADKFAKPPLLAPNSYQWKDLVDYKNNVQKNLTGDDLLFFQLHDLLESGQLAEASDFVTNNLSKLSSLQAKEQMSLILYASQGRNKDIAAIEKSNHYDLDSELNQLIIAQAKIDDNPDANIDRQLSYFESKQIYFYRDWITLEKLIKKNSKNEIRSFLKEHFITVNNFMPVFEAKSLIE